MKKIRNIIIFLLKKKEFNIEIQEYNRSFKSESIKEKYNKMLEVYKKKNYYNRFEIMDI